MLRRNPAGRFLIRAQDAWPIFPHKHRWNRPSLSGSWIAIFALVLLATLFANAQVANRISQAIDSNEVVALKGTVPPLAQAKFDIGAVSGDTGVNGVSIYFKPSAAQQADLALLLQEQQNPASPNYHRWLTPAQYASRYGMSTEDLGKIQTWLESQGFTVDGVSTSRNRIFFSGNAAQIKSAFQTELHRYQINGETHIANSSEISVPAAIAGVVLGVRNLSDFRPKPRHIPKALPHYTSSTSGDHYLTPDDFTTIYDINSQYNAGYTGSGKTIVVVGQSAIKSSDVANFRSAAGLPSNAPTFTLVPNSGTSVTTDTNGDEDESDIDVEWSGGVAKAATINFVYVGNNQTYSVFDALQYAVENDLAPVISISYGGCEANQGNAEMLSLQSVFAEANAQGQTILAASGDEGAADCEVTTNPGETVVNGDEATQGLAVDFPGSSPNVTAVGGTEFNEGSGDYWNGSNNSMGGSATKYIPEVVWNDTSTQLGLEAGGGGKSIVFGKPSWQTGTGVPADGARDVPDISINASPNHDGYLYCASGDDSTSCSNGFRDSSGTLTVAGGTSFGAPTSAAILTLVNQQLGSSGQGNVNPLLYAIAAASPDAFHDITSGNNEVPCKAGSTDCGSSGEIGYSATTGYDLASGWGSIDGYNLAQAFATQTTGSSSSSIGTTTVLTGSTTSPAVNNSVTFTATIAADSSGSTPTGTVQFAVDGTNSGSPVSLSSGTATFSNTFTTAGSHTVTASYSGNATDSASSASLTFSVSGSTTTSKGSFTLSATNVSVSPGNSGTSTITVTPSGGYTGTVAFTASVSNNLTNSCYTANNVTVTGTAAVTTTLTIYTSESQCVSSSMLPLAKTSFLKKSASSGKSGFPTRLGGLGATLASVFLLGFGRLRNRRGTAWIAIAFLGVLTLGIGCGGGSSGTTNGTGSSADSAAGTYTVTVTGTDATNNISSTATFTLTVQ